MAIYLVDWVYECSNKWDQYKDHCFSKNIMITKITGPCVGSLGLAGSTSVFKETLPEHEANMSKHTS